MFKINAIHPILLLLFFILNLPKNQAQSLDYQILKSINQRQSPADDDFYKFISDSEAPLSIGAPLIMMTVGFLDKNKTLREAGMQTAVALALTSAETYVLKRLFDRPRPSVTHPDIRNLQPFSSASFPSGHTSSAFSVATSLSLNYPKWYVIVPAYSWASLSGFSRLYLGVHYPSDVLAGAILGSGTAWLTWKGHKILRGYAEKKRQAKSQLVAYF